MSKKYQMINGVSSCGDKCSVSPNTIIILLGLIFVWLSQTTSRANDGSDSNRILMKDKERKGDLWWKRCPGGECLIDSLPLHIASKWWLTNRWWCRLQANLLIRARSLADVICKNPHAPVDLHFTVIQQHQLQEISVSWRCGRAWNAYIR